MTWKPPEDEVVQDSEWKPPTDEKIQNDQPSKSSGYTPVSAVIQKTADEINIPSRIGRGVGVAVGGASEATGLSPSNLNPGIPITPEQITELIHAAKNPQETLKKIAEAAVRGYQVAQPGEKPTKKEEPYAKTGEAAANLASIIAGGIAGKSLQGAAQLAFDTALAGGSVALPQAQSGAVKVLPSATDEGNAIKDFAANPGIKTGLNMLPDSVVGNALIPGVSKAIPKVTNAFQDAVKAVSLKTLPGIFKGTAGIPQQATEMAIKDPAILKQLEGTQQAVSDKVNKVIDAVQEAKLQVGQSLGKIFKKYAGMDSPVDEILNSEPEYHSVIGNKTYKAGGTPEFKGINPNEMTGEIKNQNVTVPEVIGTSPVSKPARSFDDVKSDWKAAKDGSLFRTQNNAGGNVTMTNAEKLATLTRLKRESNKYANYFKQVGYQGTGAAPIDSSMSVAAKKIANDISNSSGTGIRDVLANGKKLMAADDAWSGIHEIYNTLQKDLSDPGKAQDAIMKLVKGDVTWLTGGRMAQKVSAIRRIEQMTGQKVLEPAMKEMAAAIFKQNYGKGLAPIVGAGELGTMLTLLGTGHPQAAASLIPMVAAGSPRIVGGGIRAAQSVGKYGQQVAERADVRNLFNELLKLKK